MTPACRPLHTSDDEEPMMDDLTGPARGRRMIEDVDASVLETEELSVADLFADATTTTQQPADTVLGLFCQQAAALAELTYTELRELEPELAEQAAALALIDAVGVLRHLADTKGPNDPATADRLAQLADALERDAGGLLYARGARRR
jgi:hypothetical protein